MVRHQLRPQDRGSATAEIDALECIAIRSADWQAGAAAQLGSREQASLVQPRSSAVRLDNVPDTGIASGETRRSVAQAIPSTSIIE
jgi:hypothetical protein